MNNENNNNLVGEVNNYYDKNTKLFLKLGVDKEHFNIHQPLWSPSVKTQSEAANYSNLQIALTIGNIKKPNLSILDLGCGVGGGLMFLNQYFKNNLFEYYGLTLSQKQVDIAQDLMQQLNTSIHISQGNFQETAQHFQQVDVVYMIEAFIHSPNFTTLIEQVSTCLTKDGLFIIVDDWLNTDSVSANETKWINQYKKKWLIGSLVTTKQLEQTCKNNQLQIQKNINFTPFIKTDLRNKLLRLINLPLKLIPIQSAYIDSVIGGIARHYCLKQNWINYRMMVFKKN